jgi:hypothetical protein
LFNFTAPGQGLGHEDFNLLQQWFAWNQSNPLEERRGKRKKKEKYEEIIRDDNDIMILIHAFLEVIN